MDEKTSRNEEITDRLGNKAAYEYDIAGRTTKITSKKVDGTEIANVGYNYDAFDNMTKIIRGDGMNYVLAYNAYHNLESVGIEGKSEKLVTYGYKTGNGRLKEITYTNGDKMKAAYNSIGQLVAEKWYNSGEVLTAHYKYIYDGQGNIVRSIDVLEEKEYNYIYDNGNLVRAVECTITLDEDENVTAKTAVNTIIYVYDKEGKLIRKRIFTGEDAERVITYLNTDDNTSVQFTVGGKNVTSASVTDGLGRKTSDSITVDDVSIFRQFSYMAGQVTAEHQAYDKGKTAATTQLVSQIVWSDGRTLCYEYDKEERITSVVESYEVNDETVTNTTSYTYGDSVWKDKLTKVGDKTIAYDAQGNPTSYLGHTLTLEKGRQLKTFDNISYTYNAHGIRTSKTVDGVKHTFTLDGSKILREVWGSNVLIPMYDNEDSVCGVIYNDVPFYFLKNLQGDVVAITDKNGEVVARYAYDAWGVCSVASDTSGVNIAEVNPYRYRGYYYDSEIGMYYLQSRYYDASVGRFVNGDAPELLGAGELILSYNLFSYCENDLMNSTDSNGCWVARAIVAAVSGTIFGAIAYAIGRAVGLNGWRLAGFTAAFVAVGIIVGGIWGVSFLKTVNNLIKPVIYFFRNPKSVYFGVKFLGKIQFEIHHPHHNKPIHFVVRWFFDRNPGFKDWWFGK